MNASNLGSARVSRVGDGVPPSRTFHNAQIFLSVLSVEKDCFGETPKPARETRALPNPGNHDCRR
jgi:hypothetical protein